MGNQPAQGTGPFCANCGGQLAPVAKFCAQCGQPANHLSKLAPELPPSSRLGHSGAAAAQEPGAAASDIEPGAFFQAIARVDTSRDYTIIVDASGSMWSAGSNGKTRWEEAAAAVAHLVPHACRCDPDGISLYFFGSRCSVFICVLQSVLCRTVRLIG